MIGKIKIDATDRAFSLFIRKRDNWTCVRCGRFHGEGAGTIGNSHFWSRRHENTRFDPENCDSLCNAPCHFKWGGDDRPEYVAWKKKQLGEQRYKMLMVRSQTYKKRDRKMELIIAKQLLKDVDNLNNKQ